MIISSETSLEIVPSAELSNIEKWTIRINSLSINTAVKLGKELILAKNSLEHGEWLAMFESGRLAFHQRTAQRLMQIASNPALSNTMNSSDLPASTEALVILSRLPPDVIRAAMRAGRITNATTIVQAKKFAQKILPPKRVSRKMQPYRQSIDRLKLFIRKQLAKFDDDQLADFLDVLQDVMPKEIERGYATLKLRRTPKGAPA